jgi:hypothetical protein
MSTLKATTQPLNEPTAVTVAPTPPGSTIVPAIDLLRVFSPGQWEDFALEWAHSLKARYQRVERCGGAGDLGRDVVALVSDDEWHNYQCKHYREPLQPNQVVLELGKLCYYVHEKAFSAPSEYYFVAPQGAGNSLSLLFKKPEHLRARLIKDWATKCEEHITSTKKVPLTGELLDFVEGFDFSIVSYVPPMDLIEQHARTRWHAARFPGGLPPRPQAVVPHIDEEKFESPYIGRLLEAYSDHTGVALTVADLAAHEPLHRHLLRSRERFFHAESLRNFSRDTLPPGQFEDLQEEFFDAVIDTVEDTCHADGFQRVKVTTGVAQQLHPTNNALRQVLGVKDKAGICHQLADNARLKWVP